MLNHLFALSNTVQDNPWKSCQEYPRVSLISESFCPPFTGRLSTRLFVDSDCLAFSTHCVMLMKNPKWEFGIKQVEKFIENIQAKLVALIGINSQLDLYLHGSFKSHPFSIEDFPPNITN